MNEEFSYDSKNKIINKENKSYKLVNRRKENVILYVYLNLLAYFKRENIHLVIFKLMEVYSLLLIYSNVFFLL